MCSPYIVLRGRVSTGKGDFGHWIKRLRQHYASLTGTSLFPGTLNLQLDRHFELPKRQIRLESTVYGGDVSVNIVPCRFMGRRAFILCTDPDNTPERTMLEIASDLNLRSAYGLVDGQIVEVEVEEEPDVNFQRKS
jgi:CTP-dependent riboflavin kinase